jgi:hypothetical protein
MKMRLWWQSARFKTVGLLAGIALAALSAGDGRAEEPQPGALRVVITAKFTLPQVSQPIAGSQETVAAAAWKDRGEMRLLSQNQFAALGLDWAALNAKNAASAAAELAQIKPELIRDARGVLECAIVHSEGDLTGLTLAPDFLKRFAPLFGSKLLVAIPDRHTLFIFPKLASRYPDYAERVLTVYRKSPQPVSREVYEASAAGLRAIGVYEQ